VNSFASISRDFLSTARTGRRSDRCLSTLNGLSLTAEFPMIGILPLLRAMSGHCHCPDVPALAIGPKFACSRVRARPARIQARLPALPVRKDSPTSASRRHGCFRAEIQWCARRDYSRCAFTPFGAAVRAISPLRSRATIDSQPENAYGSTGAPGERARGRCRSAFAALRPAAASMLPASDERHDESIFSVLEKAS